MTKRVFWLDRRRIVLIVIFCCYFWRFFDPTAYAPLNTGEMLPAGLCFAALLPTFAFAQGREAFVISLYLVAPIKFIEDFAYLVFVLIPTALLYNNWGPFVLYEVAWSLPFYLVLVWLWRTTSGRGLGLLGLVTNIWVFPLAMALEGLQLLTIKGLGMAADETYHDQLVGSLVAICLLCVFLARLLWPRRIHLQNPGVLFDLDSRPGLEEWIRGVSQAAGVDTQARICLSALPNISIDLDGERLGFGGQPLLIIGLPLLAVLSRLQLRSLILHEMAHFSRRHLGLHRLIYRTLISLSHFPNLWLPRNRSARELAAAAGRFWLYGPLLLPLAVLLRRAMRPVRRSFELEADKEAARVSGTPASVITALEELAAARQCYLRRHGGAAPAPSMWAQDEFSQFRAYWFSKAGQSDKLRALQEEETGTTFPTEEYPSLRERVSALEKVRPSQATAALVDDGEPSYLFFADSLAGLQGMFAASRGRATIVASRSAVAASSFGQVGEALGALPEEPHSEDSPAPNRLQFFSILGRWNEWVEQWRQNDWFQRAANLGMVLTVAGALAWMVTHEVNNIEAQRRTLAAETRFNQGLRTINTPAVLISRSADDFLGATQMNPRYARAYNDLGYVLRTRAKDERQDSLKKKDLREALLRYEHAIQLNPHYPKAYENSGEAYYLLSDYASALTQFHHSEALDFGTGHPQHSLGTVYFRIYHASHQEADLKRAKDYFCDAVRRPNVESMLKERWNSDCTTAARSMSK